jgi:membrane protein insertase Oxa1/YidC/SpoIIIJ
MVLKTVIEFFPSVHHPVVEVLKHTCSPLSAALYIFSIGKFNMHPSTQAYFTARKILKENPHTPVQTKSPTSSASSTSDPNKKQYSTMSRAFSAANSAFYHRLQMQSPAVGGLRFKNPTFQCGNIRPGFRSHQFRMMSTSGAAASVASATTPAPEHHVADAASRFSAEKLQGLYEPEVIPEVLHHIQNFWSVKQVESLLYQLNEATGLPWWATIIAFTLCLRTFTTGFNVLLLRNTLRMKVIRSDIEEINQKLTDPETPHEEKVAESQRLMDLLKERGCHPLNNWIIPFLFPPLILSVFGAMHNMCLAEPAFATGGALWFTNMMDVDHSYVLYVASSLTWLWNVEIAGGSFYLKDGKIRMVTRMIALGSIPIVATMPCGVMLFWITSNLWEITRVNVLRNESLRKKLGIPLESELPKMVIGYW